MKRRRVLSILAGMAALPIVGAAASAQTNQWRGMALGAQARIILDHPEAQSLISEAVMEIRRLENIFSLYLGDSELSRLNREGVLPAPSFEMVELLSQCTALNKRTSGAFDPTVQSLWALYAHSYAQGLAPDEEQILAARALTGWNLVRYSSREISFERPGMMLTLNGIAQGFIADKITALFRQRGVENVLVNTGEISALGLSPDGNPWPVQIQNGGDISLTNRAIATSAALGTVFDKGGKVGHIIDPRNGRPGAKWSQISIISNSASEADGLSTAFMLMGRSDMELAKGDAEILMG